MTKPPTIRSKAAKFEQAARVYAAVFADAPCPFLILTPDLRIVEGNPAYLSATGRHRNSLVDQAMFDAFPDNPADPLADGVFNLRASFERALTLGARNLMPLQRYDVRDERGCWQVRYWKPANWPVLDDGRPVALVHHVMDVTEQAQAQAREPNSGRLGLIDRADLATHDARRLRVEVEARLRAARRASEAAIRRR